MSGQEVATDMCQIKIIIRYVFKHGKIENKYRKLEKKGYFVFD